MTTIKKNINNKSLSFSNCLLYAFVAIVCLLVSGCNILTIEKHRAIRFYDVEFLFYDDNGQNYFLSELSANRIIVYCDDTAKEPYYYHYRSADFYNYCTGSNSFSPKDITANSSYVALCGWDFTLKSGNKILLFDKSLNLAKIYYYDSNDDVGKIICNETHLYSVILKRETRLCELHRLDLETFEDAILLDDMSKSNSFTDGDFELFYDDNLIGTAFGNLSCRNVKTKLLQRYDDSVKGMVLFTNDNKIYINKNDLYIKNNNQIFNIANTYGINKLYPKAYIQEGKLIFAGLNYRPDKTCFTYGDKTVAPCFCGLKESYLFVYDLKANVLHSTKAYPKGTFLIDYGLNETQYYFDGGLYVEDSLVRECEKIEIGPVEKFSRFKSYTPSWDQRHYRLCFHDNEFFGI